MAVRHKRVAGGSLLDTMLALFVLMVAMLALSSVQLRALLQSRDALLRAEVIAEAQALGEAALLWREEAAAQRQEDWERWRQRLALLTEDGQLEARLCRGAVEEAADRCASQGAGAYLSLVWRGVDAEGGSGRFEYRYAQTVEAP